MRTVRLNNGVEMPLVGFGTSQLEGQACVEGVANALQLGYRLVDTAQMYGNEEQVGQGIRASGVPREEIFVTTKLDRRSNSYLKAKQAVDISLARLGLDYVDLLLVHEPYPQGPEMYRALAEACQVGKARAVGISNYSPERYARFLAQCEGPVPAVNQVEAHLYFQKWAFQRTLEEHGTVMQGWAPLAQAMEGAARHPVLAEIGARYGKSPAQVALRALVQRGVSVIPKSGREDRRRENLALFDFSLTQEGMDQIRTLDQGRTLFPWTEAF